MGKCTKERRGAEGMGLVRWLVTILASAGVFMLGLAVFRHDQAASQLLRQARRGEAATKQELQKVKQEMRRYEAYVANLIGERRAAEAVVEEQTRDNDGQLWTKIKFQEYSVDGQPIEPVKVFTVPSDVVYFDALVMTFKHDRVAEGKAKSLYLFRRVFTDQTRPDMGYKLFDPDGRDALPASYQAPAENEIPLTTQRQVWERFRKCLADPEYATTEGVDTIYGEAIYDTLRKGTLYTLYIQNDGGLELKKKPIPPVLQ